MAANPPTASVYPLYSQDENDLQVSALKLPQHSIEAEQSVLGGLLLNNEAWERIGDMVSVDDFYRDDHRKIFFAIAKLIVERHGGAIEAHSGPGQGAIFRFTLPSAR